MRKHLRRDARIATLEANALAKCRYDAAHRWEEFAWEIWSGCVWVRHIGQRASRTNGKCHAAKEPIRSYERCPPWRMSWTYHLAPRYTPSSPLPTCQDIAHMRIRSSAFPLLPDLSSTIIQAPKPRQTASGNWSASWIIVRSAPALSIWFARKDSVLSTIPR